MSNIDASALKVLAKGRHRLPPPPVDGNPQITGRPQITTASTPEDADTLQAMSAPTAHDAAATVCPLAARQHETSAVAYRRMDGRTMRKTGRTLQLATKVRPEFDETLRGIAHDEGLLIVEVLERSLALYQQMAALASATGETPQQAMQRLLGGNQ